MNHISNKWPQSDQVTWNAVNGGANAGKNYQNTFVSLSFTHLLQLLLNNTSEKKVGIVIEPSQVRLVTGADDLYAWKVLPQKKDLFSKNISEHSIGAYKELCDGIDSAFEAVPVTTKTRARSAEYVQEILISTEVCKHIKFLILTNKFVKVSTGELQCED